MTSKIMTDTKIFNENINIYKSIFANIKLPLVVVDHNWKFIYQNMEHHNFFNYPSELFKEKDLFYFNEDVFEIIKEEVEEDESFKTEMELPTGYDINVYVELEVSTITNEQTGAHQFYCIVFFDKTEIRNNTRKLELANENFDVIFNKAPEAIIIFENVNGIILKVNPYFQDWLGYFNEEVYELSIKDISASFDYENFTQKKNSKIITTTESQYYKKDKTLVDVEISSTQIRYSKMDCTLIFARDITEKKRVREELIKAKEEALLMVKERDKAARALERKNYELEESRKKAEAATEAKSSFLANMSHEIRTPLNAILGINNLLSETRLNEEQHDYVNDIKNASEALLIILNDILDISKIETGKLEIEYIADNIRNITENVVEMLNYQAFQKKLELSSYISPEIPDKIILDPYRIRQILINLIGNAIKFTEKGSVRTCLTITEINNKKMLKFEIKDTGIGIARENQDKLFHSFSQVDVSTTRKYGGSGLGLSICYNLVKLMKGDIWIESTVGNGSNFIFTIPLTTPVGSPKARVAQKTTKGEILLLSNSKEIERIIKSYLGFEGLIIISPETTFNTEENYQDLKRYSSIIIDLDFENNFKLIESLPEQFFFKTCILYSRSIQNKVKRLLVRNNTFKELKKPLTNGKLKIIYETEEEKIRTSVRPKSQNRFNDDLLILIVDDVALNRKLTSRYLLKEKINYDFAENGLEALNLRKTKKFSLIFMDCSMPVMDGYEATRKIREYEKSGNIKRIPIVALSANALKSEQEKAFESGMDDYLVKPVKKESILEMITKWQDTNNN